MTLNPKHMIHGLIHEKNKKYALVQSPCFRGEEYLVVA